ncbi:MAG TPA: hypothetical protein K8V00_01690 [Ligilactobacillus acidipiscis]|uniref:Phage protein n=1 Tax=Ligilactobacillus acidipiscis TaxID=89059 RepID=A0A921JZV7_9LACO|nr:hypothetical protein [Ligilactobacillus acidipiscis]
MDLELLKQWVGILSQAGFFGMFAWLAKSGVSYMQKKHALEKEKLMAKDKERKQWLENHDKNVEAMKQVDENLKAGNVAVLHHMIYENCKMYLDNGYISTGELNDLEYLFRSYQNLGGNGTGKILYSKCQNLPVKGDAHIEEN